ncbi:MAG: OsmC family protein [Myxococcales bacterium]
MAVGTLKVKLERIGPAAFRAQAASGGELIVDGAPDIGGEGRGMRPMELLVSSIASCASMDVVHILRKQGELLTNLEVYTEAQRKDATPAPITNVHLRFVAHGGVNAHKLERAVKLSVEKYCSVIESLSKDITVTHEAQAV